MKILFISDEYSVGGAAKSLGEVVLGLRNQGVECVVCTSKKDDFSNFLDKNGIKNLHDNHLGAMTTVKINNLSERIMWIRAFYSMRRKSLRILEEQLDLKSFDLVHTNSARNEIGCLIHKKYHIPHIMHLREFGIEDFGCTVLMPFYYHHINKNSNTILAVSDSVRNSWIKKGLKAKKCLTIYNGIDFTNIIVKDRDSFSRENLKIVFVGGICKTKGQHYAIEAIKDLNEKIKERVSVDFIGWDDPEYLTDLKKKVAAYNLEKQIQFLGERQNVGALLANYDVGVMCSKSEGFGRVTVEYMYAGLGVIVPDTGASPEIVTDGYTGQVFKHNDLTSLTACIENYFNDRKLLRIHSENAHIIAQKKFSTTKNVNEILKIYHQIIDTYE